MPAHIDYDDPKYAEAAREVLRRHDAFEAEANITSAVRRFLTETGLVQSDEIVEENPPAEGSRQAVDLTALDTFIEFKRRTGSTGGFDPNPDYVEQLDDYLAQSQEGGRVRMGVLTDGRHWLLRWPGAGPVKLVQPYAFTLDDADRWPLLHAWLRDNALSAESNVVPTRESIAKHFGPDSPHYERDIAAFAALYSEYAAVNTIKVKRELWEKLLTAALGEIAFTRDAMGQPVRPAHVSYRRGRHGRSGVVRHRHPCHGGERPRGPAVRPRLPQQDRTAGRRRVGLLRVARRGRR